jgi:hypothetical protein
LPFDIIFDLEETFAAIRIHHRFAGKRLFRAVEVAEDPLMTIDDDPDVLTFITR